jgi:imidazolonepropionase-like amidohydrolase
MTESFQPLRQFLALLVFQIGIFCRIANAAELLPPGFRPLPLGVHALAGGRIVVKPGEVIDSGTIVIRDGLIKAVGKDIKPPPDARVWDMKGATIYAGFIDPYLVLGTTNPPVATSDTEPISAATFASAGIKFFGVPGAETDMGSPGPGYELAKITPEYRTARDYSPKSKTLEPLRELGFTSGVIAPAKGIIRGTSVLVALVEENPNDVVLKADVFQHIAFDTRGGEDRSYPGSLMGIIAVVRQSVFDAQHYALDHADYQKHPQDRSRPEFNPAREALSPAVDKKMRVVFEPGSALMVDRAARVAAELGLEFWLVSSGQEWRRPDLAKTTAASFIVPLNFPDLPKLPSESDWDQVSLDQLRAWDWAPENPALLRQQGLELALTTYGLNDKKKFRQNLRLALDRGFSESDALAALTTTPAKLCGVEDRLGTIEAGKLANLTVVDGKGYFDTEAKVREVWIDGRIYRGPVEEPKSGKAEETKAAKPSSPEGGEPAKPKPEPEKKPGSAEPVAKSENKSEPAKEESGEEKKDKKKEQARELQKTRVAHSPLEGRGLLAGPKTLLVQNATVWTCGPQGRLENADVLVADGKIKAVGKALSVPSDPAASQLVIDGHGLHVTPGLIDCHNHSMILGSVNEGTLPSTAMVRIRDVVNSESDNLEYQLAGGVTVANLLHGSANPIGGQNCVIKLRNGANPEQLIFEAAPAGIKFALGENVKQANWGDRFTTRFPQSRMGVRTFIANRFTAAQEYLAQCDKCKTSGAIPPRRNLELEAIGEILTGRRWIHCHSYRQDEILMLIHLMEDFGVKIGTFQHVLEGYKVADEIAKHGAGASTFADWWAYKFEVYDAIPYNGSLMRDRGVVVSFNSDSSDLARRLYTEAAKAVKYGGTSEQEALKFVTLNPAQQLRIDKFVGSLEPGKDADFVVWSKSPLDSGTVCLQTWIDGQKYFDRTSAEQHGSSLVKERDALLVKAKKIAKLSGGGREGSGAADTAESFFRVSLEHEFDGHDRGCLDEQ